MESYQKIIEIENWYLLNASSQGLHDIINKADQLAVYISRLGEVMAEANKDWTTAKAEYEKKKSQAWITLKTENKAKANTVQFHEKRNLAESNFRRLEYKFKSAENVLRQMNQRISQLKKEWEKENR